MERARASSAIVATILSVLLAAVFVAAALPKLTGSEPLILEATAMRHFPAWIRTVVGVVELSAAIGLLIPATSAVAAIVLALMMLPATITQRVDGGLGILIPVSVFVLLLTLAATRRPDAVRALWQDLRSSSHPIFRNGVIAGVIGATVIAVWFFAVDLVAGQAFLTPSTLGRGLFSAVGAVPDSESPMVHVIAYTIFHCAAFITVGIIAAAMVRLAEDAPSVLRGFVILFVVFEAGFYASVTALWQVAPLGGPAWWKLLLGNLIAAAAMGVYLLRKHPVLQRRFSHGFHAQPWRERAQSRK